MGGIFFKTRIMYTEFFEKIKTESNKIKVPNHGLLIMDQLTIEKAKELFDEGFTFLALTKKGATHYFGELKANEIIKLIAKAKCEEDVVSLASIKACKETKAAATIRLKELKG